MRNHEIMSPAQMRMPDQAKPLADFLDVCLGPSLAAQGFATSDVIVAWPEIVGERLAAFTQPLKIEWKRKAAACRPGGAAGARRPWWCGSRAPSPSRCSISRPRSIERVNTHYGWRCIGRIVLKQGPVQARREEARRPRPLLDRGGRRAGRRRRRSRSRRTGCGPPSTGSARPSSATARARHESVTTAALATKSRTPALPQDAISPQEHFHR